MDPNIERAKRNHPAYAKQRKEQEQAAWVSIVAGLQAGVLAKDPFDGVNVYAPKQADRTPYERATTLPTMRCIRRDGTDRFVFYNDGEPIYIDRDVAKQMAQDIHDELEAMAAEEKNN